MEGRITNLMIEQCKANNRASQKQLYHMLLPYLSPVCKRYLNDSTFLNDVLQETFILIFTKLHQFDFDKGKFKTWAIKISINCCLKQNQKFARVKELEQDDLVLRKNSIHPKVLHKYSNDEIMQFLKRMPEQYFQVFNLFVLDGFSHKEIAELLDINDALSRKRLSRAKAWLEKRWVAQKKWNTNIL